MLRPAGSGRLAARVDVVESLGADTLIYTNTAAAGPATSRSAGVTIIAKQNTRTSLRVGDMVGLDIAPASFHLFDRQGHVVASAA